ncbi:hypothetical protein [Nonomuraea aridisoli]|uniref:Glycosyltransferase RgtA/B/C/D-like domain-containing protein n=1 Tax=Nonomuraea aridisoli TaxID=2070368 RepID=A0A2W2FWL1_9ACTN|nr:hypothetical protein [Nonomuraea aridisoli]PZG19234.1 hypothetical protein C1J01_12860 [Nonomuraea aridisoli]
MDEVTAGRARAWIGAHRAHLALALVAGGYTALQLALTVRIGLGWDESVYLSQVARGVPAAEYTAPRARGVQLLAAPIAVLTPSVTAIRVYLSLLSGLALFLAYLPWLRLRTGVVAPLAAALFAGLWLSLLYANAAMPNMWVAYSGVAGVGLACLAETRPQPRAATAGVVAAFALASLLRPMDATWLALPLLAYGIARRRPRPLLATAAGLAIGWGEWLAEALWTFGGPLARLHAAGAENATGLHFSLPDHLRALNGPLLCRFGTDCGGVPLTQAAWFAAVPVLAALGVAAARRRAVVAALACGLSLAVSYLFTVGYAAPRFLLPAYALLALPVAAGVTRLCRRRAGAVLAFIGLLGYFAVQVRTLVVEGGDVYAARAAAPAVAARLKRAGMRPPCFLYGRDALQIGYLTGCAAHGVYRHYGGTVSVPSSITAALGRREWVGVLTTTQRPPAPFLTTWTPLDLGLVKGKRWRVYVPPPT